MADNRKPYTVNLGGVQCTLLLTPEAADKYENAVEVKAAPAPTNKSRTVDNKSGK